MVKFLLWDAAVNSFGSLVLWLHASAVCVWHQCLKLALWAGKIKACVYLIFMDIAQTPPYRGCANSRYTTMTSDLSPHGWASFLIGANLWVEEWYPINCVYVASVLTQVRLRICVWETHCHSVFEGNEDAVCLCVLLVLFLLICRNSSHIKDMT